jgi:DNA-binding NarL/FixJ family response regulator
MKQVLIVDDSSRVRKRIASLLDESPQIRIVGEAGNGREALELVERKRPDAILLDIRLPDQSGIALLKRFKSRYPEIAVIMLTNLDGRLYRQQCRHWGADHFLSKSKDFERVLDTIINYPGH